MKQSSILVVLTVLLFSAAGAMAENSDLIFSHRFHAENVEAACLDCHAAAENSLTGRDDLLPEMELCGECHDIEAEGNCTLCHKNGDEPILLERIDGYLPLFPHQQHVDGDESCLTCHRGVETAMDIVSQHLPKMKLCMSCHDTPLTFNGCATCHLPGENLLPADHQTGWMHAHGSADMNDCSLCHTSSTCEDCHLGEEGLILFHSSEFATTHGMDFRMKTMECALCHQDYSSCRTCHETNMVAPLSHGLPFYTVSGHGVDAISDPDYCRVCHDTESTGICATCH